MRRLLGLVLLLNTFCAAAQYNGGALPYLNDSETVASFREHIRLLSSAALEGRKSGSEGEKEAAAYVSEVFAGYGLDLLSGAEGEVFGMKRESGDTLVSRNVIAYIPGYDPQLKDKYIVIGARLDNLGTSTVSVDGNSQEKIFYGANGNASGLAMMMELARMLSTNRVLLKRSVLFVAFGSSLNMNAGSWYFLNRSFNATRNIEAMVNLDMLGTGSRGFYAYTASNRDMNALLDEVSSSLQPVRPDVVAREPVNSDHRMFYDREIPSVFFTTGMYPEYNSVKDVESIIEYADMERELEYIYNFSIALVNGRKPEFRVVDERSRRFSQDRDVVAYSDCDFKPIFLGSTDPAVFMQRWVYVYLRYPKEAVEKGIQGRVLVNFVITEKGKVTNVHVAKGVHELLDEEAVRVIAASPDWKPARVRGQKVKCEMSVYVEFKLERRKR